MDFVRFDFGLGSVTAESATPDFRLRRSVTLSRSGCWLLGLGVFARISAAVGRRPVVFFAAVFFAAVRLAVAFAAVLLRPAVFFPELAFVRAGVSASRY